MKFYETQAFRDLEKEWDARLAEAGFRDAEKMIGADRKLKQGPCSGRYRQAKEQVRAAKIAYYEAMGAGFAKEVFLEHKVMQDYVNGKTRIEIHRELIAAGLGIEYETIRFIIRRYEYKWGIKHYTPQQMNLRKPPSRS